MQPTYFTCSWGEQAKLKFETKSRCHANILAVAPIITLPEWPAIIVAAFNFIMVLRHIFDFMFTVHEQSCVGCAISKVSANGGLSVLRKCKKNPHWQHMVAQIRELRHCKIQVPSHCVRELSLVFLGRLSLFS